MRPSCNARFKDEVATHLVDALFPVVRNAFGNLEYGKYNTVWTRVGMLREDQAAELLSRCEAIAGLRLQNIRGQLQKAETRAAAVWELLSIEAFSCGGSLAYEPPGDSSPDIVFSIAQAPDLWVEIAYLHPRFWRNEARANALTEIVWAEAQPRGIRAQRIYVRFTGDQKTLSGVRRNLPRQHELRRVLGSPVMRSFFQTIVDRPSEPCKADLSPYTVILEYDPTETSPFFHSGGLAEEAPKAIEEHGLFRALREKARQHRPDGPYLICVGADQSDAIGGLAGPFGVSEQRAIESIFRQYPHVSAALLVKVRYVWSERTLGAEARLYRNLAAAYPLTTEHVEALMRLDFNRWKFYYALSPTRDVQSEKFRQSGGPLKHDIWDDRLRITVPSTFLVDCLLGKRSLSSEFSDDPQGILLTRLENGWQIVSCSTEPGSIEDALSVQVVLELRPGPDRVFSKPPRTTRP